MRSAWASCHVRGGGIELFAARTPGHANPLAGAIEPAMASEPSAILTAPHLGTPIEIVAIGSRVAAGERYGAIGLLDETIDLVTDRAGTIGRPIAQPRGLVQYDEPLVTLH